MKILLITGLSNPEIRDHLNFFKDRKIYHLLIRLFHIPDRVGQLGDCVPWAPKLISALENNPEVELHVFAPHIRLKKRYMEFVLRGVTYHFYRMEYTSLLRKIGNYKIWKRLQNCSYYFKKVLKKVEPDLVVLSGAENPASSVAILYAKDYPKLCLCQTIYNNPQRPSPDRLIQELEKDIFLHVDYYGVYCKLHYELLRQLNPKAHIFKFGYPGVGKMRQPTPTEKIYDFVNFAMLVCDNKGYYDAVRALAIVKEKHPSVTLNLVGKLDAEARSKMTTLIADLELSENVVMTPFFPLQSDMLLHIQKSRYALLPCKLDNTSGTMNQAMQLGLPMIVYRTSGTPCFNNEKECVLIAEHSNVEDLAAKMLILLDNPEKADVLRQNALEYQKKRVEQIKNNGYRLWENYQAVVAHYRSGQPIPQEQLFDPERDD